MFPIRSGRQVEEREGFAIGELLSLGARGVFGGFAYGGVVAAGEEIPIESVGQEGAEAGAEHGECAGERFAAEPEEFVEREAAHAGGGTGDAGGFCTSAALVVGKPGADVFAPHALQKALHRIGGRWG